jgi:hypothetical protein
MSNATKSTDKTSLVTKTFKIIKSEKPYEREKHMSVSCPNSDINEYKKEIITNNLSVQNIVLSYNEWVDKMLEKMYLNEEGDFSVANDNTINNDYKESESEELMFHLELE